MFLKPRHIVPVARGALVLGVLAVVALTLGPFAGAEEIFGLNDKLAHALAFGGLLAIAFFAFPFRRRIDMMLIALAIGAGVEIAQAYVSRSSSLLDFVADAAGIYAVYVISMIERWRWMIREQGALTFAEIAAMDARRAARRANVTFEPQEGSAEAANFAERASQRFPAR
ncbi:VanZ family protein [Caulobacter sp. BP25]|jgi:VanZ family protein|uniref:VanZ family protein n=1 Tax=Caulobacter sp. BP25 TaxID=2048900 RepID=UPI000C12CD16|nr:VanZ family protein [Caulobacter sp. BP25]PHY17475.1 antibiotic resistance protein VanZ [Caulobacter sp. BP25]